jgi:hypothetical protein
MKTLKKSQIGAETKVLRKMYEKHGRVTRQMQKELEKRGYEYRELGTSQRCFTFSGEIGFKKEAHNFTEKELWGIGFHNISKGSRLNRGMSFPIYRAYVKRIS